MVLLCSVLFAMPASGAGRNKSSSLTISVFWSVISDRIIRDVPPKHKRSAGDVALFTASLTNHVPQFGMRSGALVGVEYDTITVLSARAVFIKAKATLPGGRIFSAGRSSERGAFHTIRVTGGARRYAGVRGSVTSEEIGRLASVDTYHLRLP